jgi:hypothetical protein
MVRWIRIMFSVGEFVMMSRLCWSYSGDALFQISYEDRDIVNQYRRKSVEFHWRILYMPCSACERSFPSRSRQHLVHLKRICSSRYNSIPEIHGSALEVLYFLGPELMPPGYKRALGDTLWLLGANGDIPRSPRCGPRSSLQRSQDLFVPRN